MIASTIPFFFPPSPFFSLLFHTHFLLVYFCHLIPLLLHPFPRPSVNLKVKPKELAAVVGHVGAGKSSLVQALLGEMEKVSGAVSLRVRTH